MKKFRKTAAIFFAVVFLLALMPQAYAEDIPCTCQVPCTHLDNNPDCQRCMEENFDFTRCGLYTPSALDCRCTVTCTTDAVNGGCPWCGQADFDPADCPFQPQAEPDTVSLPEEELPEEEPPASAENSLGMDTLRPPKITKAAQNSITFPDCFTVYVDNVQVSGSPVSVQTGSTVVLVVPNVNNVTLDTSNPGTVQVDPASNMILIQQAYGTYEFGYNRVLTFPDTVIAEVNEEEVESGWTFPYGESPVITLYAKDFNGDRRISNLSVNDQSNQVEHYEVHIDISPSMYSAQDVTITSVKFKHKLIFPDTIAATTAGGTTAYNSGAFVEEGKFVDFTLTDSSLSIEDVSFDPAGSVTVSAIRYSDGRQAYTFTMPNHPLEMVVTPLGYTIHIPTQAISDNTAQSVSVTSSVADIPYTGGLSVTLTGSGTGGAFTMANTEASSALMDYGITLGGKTMAPSVPATFSNYSGPLNLAFDPHKESAEYAGIYRGQLIFQVELVDNPAA